MGYTALTLGTTANDGTGEGLRVGGVKINAMFAELYAYRLDQWAAPTNAVSLNAQKITNLATPTNSGDAATKAYVDAIIAASDAMVFKGVVDCSTNPNYPAADRGHTYRVSVAGKIGGASGVNVEVGDLLTCITDSTSSGTQASVGANWTVGQTNIDGAVVGPSSATDGYVAVFDGTSGKLIKSGAIAISALAPLASPTFTGTPAAPTATGGTNTTQVATTAFVLATKLNELAAPSADVAMNSKKITGLATPTNGTDAATKAYADSVGGGGGGGGAIVAPQGRLTLSSGVAVLTATVSGAGTVYYTPHVGRYAPIYDGSAWAMHDFGGELSQALSDATKSPAAATTNSNYDLFLWNDGGTFRCTRGPAWSSSTSRGTGAGTTELDLTALYPTNKVAITNGPAAGRGTYVGTIRTNGSSLVDIVVGVVTGVGGPAAAPAIGLWNAYNRVDWAVSTRDDTPNGSAWTYSTAAWRAPNASATMRVNFVCGLDVELIEATYLGVALVTSSGGGFGVGYDSTTVLDAVALPGAALVAGTQSAVSRLVRVAGLGHHYVAPLEYGGSGLTFYGIQSSGRTYSGFIASGKY